MSVAQHELSGLLAKEEKRSELQDVAVSWTTVADLITAREKQFEDDASTKSATKKYWREIHLALHRSWPELESLQISKVTPALCEAWADATSKSSPHLP